MKTSWTKGLDARQKEEMEASFGASASVRSRMIALLQEKIKTANKERICKDGYAAANWAYLQADLSGYIRALEESISLLEN